MANETDQKPRAGTVFLLRDDSAPEVQRATIKNKKTATAVAVATCGGELLRRGFVDVMEIVNEKPQRRTTFLLNGNRKIEFKPIAKAELIEVGEAVRRFEDPEWCRANPDHPIAFLHFYAENFRAFLAVAQNRKPGRLIRRGDRFVILDDGLPREVEEQFMRDLQNGI